MACAVLGVIPRLDNDEGGDAEFRGNLTPACRSKTTRRRSASHSGAARTRRLRSGAERHPFDPQRGRTGQPTTMPVNWTGWRTSAPPRPRRLSLAAWMRLRARCSSSRTSVRTIDRSDLAMASSWGRSPYTSLPFSVTTPTNFPPEQTSNRQPTILNQRPLTTLLAAPA